MHVLQDMYDRVIKERLSPEKLGVEVLDTRFRELGIELTDAQRSILADRFSAGHDDVQTLSFEDEQVPDHLREEAQDESGHLTIDLGDCEHIIDDLCDQIIDEQSDAIPAIVDRMAPVILRSLRRSSRRMLRRQRKDRRGFERRLRRRWGRAIDTIEMMYVMACEAGSGFVNEELVNTENPSSHTWEVLIRSHSRACQITAEIVALLRGGFADGAHARWRCLHEVTVIALFIANRGDEVAERYLLHETIEAYKAARAYQENHERLGVEPLSDAEFADLKKARDDLVERYGTSYKRDYGWASGFLEGNPSNFAGIEACLDMQHMRPYYRMASHNVHANPKGVLFKLGAHPDEPLLFPAGASAFGLADPGQGTAISLMQATVALLSKEPNLDALVTCKMLQMLCDEAGEAFLVALDAQDEDR